MGDFYLGVPLFYRVGCAADVPVAELALAVAVFGEPLADLVGHLGLQLAVLHDLDAGGRLRGAAPAQP